MRTGMSAGPEVSTRVGRDGIIGVLKGVVVNVLVIVWRQVLRQKASGGCQPWVRPMKASKKALAGAAILGMASSGVAIGGGAASASTVPVVFAANADGWYAYVRPAAIYFGQGGAPVLGRLHWSSWNGTGAWATGKLSAQKPACPFPRYKCPYYSRWAGVYLNTIRSHNGIRYFARMAVKFWYGGKWRWDVGWFRNGFWTFPVVFPYL